MFLGFEHVRPNFRDKIKRSQSDPFVKSVTVGHHYERKKKKKKLDSHGVSKYP